MKNLAASIGAMILLGGLSQSWGATFYVSPSGNNTPPYGDWTAAATEIQSAVDIACDGDLIWVGDGDYQLDAEIAVTNGITVKSENGAPTAIVRGGKGNPDAWRCFRLAHAGAVVDGFTIVDGQADRGGGVHLDHGGTLLNSAVERCLADHDSHQYHWGGGVYLDHGGMVSNCVIRHCQAGLADYDSAGGGGAYAWSGGIIIDSLVQSNYTSKAGGGVRIDGVGGTIQRCRIVDNEAHFAGGGVNLHYGGLLYNSIVAHNHSGHHAGGVQATHFATQPHAFENNTIVGNSATTHSGGVAYWQGGGGYNNIVYYNTAPTDPDVGGSMGYYFCTPIDTGHQSTITNAPQFVDYVNGDYRLLSSSPCINSGTNRTWVTGATDLEENMRVQNGVVDIGAYEFDPNEGIRFYEPTGWTYFAWPYLYERSSQTWYYFNEFDTQWCVQLSTGDWAPMGQNWLAAGWVYWQWPYAYSYNSGSWFYLNEFDIQWCCDLSSGEWSRLGKPFAE